MSLSNYINSTQAEGREKHVPFIEIKDCEDCNELILAIRIGKDIFHPSTKDHYIEHIGLHGLTQDDKVIFVSRFELGKENTIPSVKVHIKKGRFKKIFAVSLCNLHGLWENHIAL